MLEIDAQIIHKFIAEKLAHIGKEMSNIHMGF